MNGNVTKEGITLDLEAMKRVGVGGCQVFQCGYTAKGPVEFDSPEYHEMLQHAARECDRLDLEFGAHNCPG